MDITVYHNPACGTSRNVLALIREAGIEPVVIEYLKTPPTRDQLANLIARAGITPRDLLREKGTPYAELGLANPQLTDDALIDAMVAHPDPDQPAAGRDSRSRRPMPPERAHPGPAPTLAALTPSTGRGRHRNQPGMNDASWAFASVTALATVRS